MTPFEALFEFTPLKPVCLVQNVHCPHPTAAEFATLLDTYHQRACDAIRTAQLKLVEKMDQGRETTKSYQVGDSVWLSSTHITGPEDSHSKLPWSGPFPVIAATPSTVTLELPEHWRLTTNTFHVKKVKKHVERPPHLGIPEPALEPVRKQGQEYWELD